MRIKSNYEDLGIFFPKNTNIYKFPPSRGMYQITFTSESTNEEYFMMSSDFGDFPDYYVFHLIPEIPDGEYRYLITNTGECGVILIGDVTPTNKEYIQDNNYIIYNG